MITLDGFTRRWQSLVIGTVVLVGMLSTGGNKGVFAQVIPDDTLGAESSVVTPDAIIRDILSNRIDGGATRGANLFHSFIEFNVAEGGGVYFTNPDGIENILSRVTGDNVSTILGRLGVLGEANLFLLNPNGILFGENASLDIEGSFVATTASGIELGEDGVFSATQPRSSRLLSVSPGALFYNAVEAAGGKITNRGNLAVGQRESLTLAGDTVTSTGSLAAPGGKVQVLGERVGLLENARIDVSSDTGGGTVLIGGAFQGQGDVPTAARTFIDTGVRINADAFRSGNGGNVIVWADEVTGFYGNISARGGSEVGNGGFVEVSGKEHLIFRGTVETTAVNGLSGTLLLDPTDIVIANGSFDGAADGTDTFAGNNSGVAGQILSVPLSEINDTAPTTIYESELEGLSGDTNVILQATNDIRIEDLADNALEFASGSGLIELMADADSDGVGAVVMEDTVADTLYTSGRDIVISGASLTLGNINTLLVEGGDLIATVDVDAGGAIPPRGTQGMAMFTFTVPDLGQPVGNLDVRFSAARTYDAYFLYVYLTSPGGTELELFNRWGFGSYNFQDILLDDEATRSINQASAMFNGTFKPEGAGGLAVFQGENPQGTWTLSVTDDYKGDSGRLFQAGDAAPQGAAIGTQLLFKTPISIGESGSINLNATNGNISVGNLNTNNSVHPGGAISLDANGSITTGILDSSSSVNGGAITLKAGGDIITQETLNSSSLANGGAITLKAGGDIITQETLNSSSLANGGAITLKAGGDITTNDSLDSDSFSYSGNAGNGGAITLFSDSGDITINSSLDSDSVSLSGNAGNGGVITLFSNSGDITTNSSLDSNSNSFFGNAGNGGAITLFSNSGDITTNSSLNSDSLTFFGNAGNGGAITLFSNSGDITTNSELNSFSFSPSGNERNGGAISLFSNSGDITTNGSLTSSSLSVSGKAGNGGGISLFSNSGDITTNSSLDSSSLSLSGNAGNGGDIFLFARDGDISGQSPNSLLASFALSETGNAGTGGNVTMTAQNNITNLEILTLSSADEAGAVEIKGFKDLSVTNTRILTSRRVEVKVPFFDEPITLEVGGQGQSGDVTVTSLGNLTFKDSSIESDTNGSDRAGNVMITSPSLVTFNNSQIISNTSNLGKAGDIAINAGGGITFQGLDSYLSVETSNAGKAGNIMINTPTLTLSDTARITATATNTAMNPEGGGSISLNASTMNLAGIVGVFADTQGQTPAGTLTLKPYQTQSTLDITLAPQSRISASTSGSGRGGNLEVSAPEAITIRGAGTLAVETTGEGAAGNLTIDTQRLTIADGATISASTASANPDGFGGNITINATESFTLNQAQLSAQSTGVAQAGNITINTGQLSATNGTIATSTEQSAGGAITITASDIRLFGDSDITSRVASGAGGGGNITLTADSIIALDDSDILAFARDGKGGDITLTTPAFFGQNYKPAPKGTDPRTLDNNDRVDINATGAIEGVITITSDTGFIENSFIQLSGNGIDTDELIAESCIARRHEPQRGSFFITGTGGIPFRPGDLYVTPYQTGTVRSIPASGEEEPSRDVPVERLEAEGESSSSTRRPWKMGDPIIEPTGIYRLPNGKVIMSRECGE